VKQRAQTLSRAESARKAPNDRRNIITMGFNRDLDEAAKLVLRNMIGFLIQSRGLDRDDAYALSSVAVDLRITQLVNDIKGVHALLPKSVFL